MLCEALDIASSSRTLRTYHRKALEFCFVTFLKKLELEKIKEALEKENLKPVKTRGGV